MDNMEIKAKNNNTLQNCTCGPKCRDFSQFCDNICPLHYNECENCIFTLCVFIAIGEDIQKENKYK